MKYPLRTNSRPVTGEEARRLIEAIDSGKSVGNEQSRAVAAKILAARAHRLAAAGGDVQRD
jgi:hypothetical protein